MKKLILITTLLLAVCTITLSQTQMNNWYMGPQKIDMTVSSPTPSGISAVYGSATAATATHVANGFYDNYTSSTIHGKLMFYISDGTVYDYNNIALGIIPAVGPEITIVPFGNNGPCQSKFNIFSTSGGLATHVGLYQSVLDMNSYSLSSNQIDEIPFGTEFGAIAVGKTFNSSGDRYLYFLGGSGFNSNSGLINKLIIYNNGSVSLPSQLYPTASLINVHSGIEVFSRELDLSPDGKWLAWASCEQSSNTNPWSKYHLLALDASTGDVNTSTYGSAAYQPFDIGAAGYNYTDAGFRGIEFDASSSKLFMGAGSDGIYYTNIAIPLSGLFTKVNGSNNSNPLLSFGFSQIELANNGYMYSSSGNTTGNNIGAFDPSLLTPSIIINQPSFPFSSPPKVVYNLGNINPNSILYTLPDQIDGQNYSAITPPPLIPVVTANIINYPANSSINQTAIWSNGTTVNNPWGTSDPVQVINELHITGNSHLIIDGMTFKFSPQAKVIIEQGSSLTLNGSTFTSDYMDHGCNVFYTWKGVQVLGYANVPQKNISGGQGQLVLNNSHIEYAECGVMTWDSVHTGYAGGIIKASSNTVFFNNKIDVEFMHYQNFMVIPSGNLNLGNSSNFKNCYFTTDVTYPFSAAPIHALINGCNGISFKGCNFEVANSTSLNTLQSIGIKLFNSGCNVSSNSNFIHLWHGIDAMKAGVNRPFRIYNSTFTDNSTAITANNINNIVAQANQFYTGGSANTVINTNVQIGIVLNNSSGFNIEENHFNLSTAPVSNVKTWGVYVFNSGSADNVIYKNYFTNLTIANYAKAINRNTSPNALSGLQYLCNTNTGNTNNDFYINPTVSSFGIRSIQGSKTLAAGNLFSHYGSAGSSTDFYNKYGTVNYYYWSTGSTYQIPSYYNSPNVIITPATVENTCPSHINNQVILAKLSEAEIQDLNAVYDSAETAYLNLLYAYNQFMDGGCTNTLLTQIQQSWSADAWQLRDALLAQSPYLSQGILRETAQQNSLPQAMLLAVCMANPDATKDDEFLSYLQYEIPNPLPQYMIDMIIASWNTITTRTTLESALADYSSVIATTSDKLLSDLYFRTDIENDSIMPLETDTINYNDTIRYWLNRVQTLTAKYDLIENYFDANELTLAQNLLDSMPYNFNMSADQTEAYNDYVYFFNFRKTLLDNGQTLADLDSGQIQYLVNFTAEGDDYAKGLAQNALCYYYNICREENYDLETTGNRMMNNQSTVTNKTNAVMVAPNPCSTYATFSYSVPMLKDKATLTLTDITGKMVKQFVLENNEGQQIWDTRDIGNGIYFYQLKGGNTIIAKGKVAVK